MTSEAGLGGLQNWFAAWKPADAAVRLRMFDGDFADTDLAEHGPEQAGERLPQAGRTDGRTSAAHTQASTEDTGEREIEITLMIDSDGE